MFQPKSYGVLTKYDEELEGMQREKFRLDERGGYDLGKDEMYVSIRPTFEAICTPLRLQGSKSATRFRVGRKDVG